MAVSLAKGTNISLTKAAPGLASVTVGLGWDARTTEGQKFDLDASAIVCDADGKVLSDKHFVFYGNKTSPDGNVSHGGDNTTGDGDGDDETIRINLAGLPAEAAKVVIAVSIYEADKNGQTFGQVRKAFARVLDDSTGAELTRYDLGEDYSTETALLFAEIYRNGDEWKYRAVGAGYANGLSGIAADFGLQTL